MPGLKTATPRGQVCQRHTECERLSKWLLITLSILSLTVTFTLYLMSHRLYKISMSLNRSAVYTTSASLHKHSQENRKKLSGCPIHGKLRLDVRLKNASENICSHDFLKNHILTARFQGRTGNRLFQMATLIATAKCVCYTPVVPAKKLAHFDEIFDLDNVKRIDLVINSFRKIFEPGSGKFDSYLTSRIDPAYNWTIFGYRQSFKYFEAHADLLRSSFKIKEKIRNDVIHYISSFENVLITVGLHVRRGDFLRERFRKIGFSVSTIDYINRAIAYVRNRLGKSRCAFIVVSDDIKWCREYIKGDDIHYSPFHDVGRDLYVLTQCNHNIVTSGSFGWMAAWLNESGMVVYDGSYPQPNTKLERKIIKDDYYPRHWIGL